MRVHTEKGSISACMLVAHLRDAEVVPAHCSLLLFQGFAQLSKGYCFFLRAAGPDAKPSCSDTMLICYESPAAASENPLAVFDEGLMLRRGV